VEKSVVDAREKMAYAFSADLCRKAGVSMGKKSFLLLCGMWLACGSWQLKSGSACCVAAEK
jgi:hypothetical protein